MEIIIMEIIIIKEAKMEIIITIKEVKMEIITIKEAKMEIIITIKEAKMEINL